MNTFFSITALHRVLTRLAVMVACFLILESAHATQATDAFSPLSLTLQPSLVQQLLPSWASSKPVVQSDSDTVLIPVPPLATQDTIGCFALTVVFQDRGDGGPVVEWQPKEGERILLCAGLGESGVSLGLNAHTLLISQSLALDGGSLRISYTGRFNRLISVTLRPARELSVAALGPEFFPALTGENEPLLTASDVSDSETPVLSGDRTEGQVIHAELSSSAKLLESDGIEFIIPVSAKPSGSMLQVEIGGLDPESWIEVQVNGQSLGPLASSPFSLNSPSVLFSSTSRLLLAGWHPFSLFLPARLWKEGDNSLLLTLHRSAGEAGESVYLRKARVDLLFTPLTTVHPAASASPTPEILSTGSAYGNPSPSLFHATAPIPLK